MSWWWFNTIFGKYCAWFSQSCNIIPCHAPVVGVLTDQQIFGWWGHQPKGKFRNGLKTQCHWQNRYSPNKKLLRLDNNP